MSSFGGEAFEEFVNAEYPRLWRLGRVLSGSDHAASDLAQDCLVRVGLRWSKVDREDGNPSAYARTCLVRMHLNECRKRRWEVLWDAQSLPDTRAAISNNIDRFELKQQLIEILLTLPPRQRAALALHYLEDRSVDEIAEIMKCRARTVKSQLAHGRASLRAAMRERALADESQGE